MYGLSTEDLAIQTRARGFADELIPFEEQAEAAGGELPADLAAGHAKRARELGLHSTNMPAELGGGGCTTLQQVLVQEQVGRVTNALGWVAATLPSWLPGVASADQIDRYVRPAIAGGKPGGEAIGVTIGDMATTRVDGTFTVAYLVYNTINNLTSQEAQVACFRNVAEHLTPGGCFVIETNIPHLRHLPPGQDILGYRAGPGRIVSYSFDHATQRYRGHYVEFTDGRGQYRTIPFRYAWPSELDLMAQLAGLRLRDRWADWNREPFTTDSRSHVSVWQKPAPPPQG